MNQLYRDWISKNVTETYGYCAEVTEQMAKSFPELRRVRGHYYCTVWGERGHWWLVDEEGNVVDPTADQFPSKGNGVYVEWDDSLPEPSGMCPNCGDYCYDGNYFCSKHCESSYTAFVMGGGRY
jgi:hypothetical protein